MGLKPFPAVPHDLRTWTKWIREALVDESVGTAQIADEAVTLAKLADLVALSVIGNPTGSSATPSAIAASVDDIVLRRTGGALSFGALTAAMFTAGLIPETSISATSGTYTGTLTGCTTSPTATVSYVKVGPIVVVSIPSLQATSNSTACTITGPAPEVIRPTNTQTATVRVLDSGGQLAGSFAMDSAGLITLNTLTGSFTAAGNKGWVNGSATYALI